MNITSVLNPIYSKSDNSTIDCIVTCELGEIPFTASPHDVMSYGITLFNDLIVGKYGIISPYVA